MFSNLDVSGLTQGVTAVCPALDDSQGNASVKSEVSFHGSGFRPSINTSFSQMPFNDTSGHMMVPTSKYEDANIDIENDTPPDPSTPSTGGSGGGMIRRAVEQWKYNLKYGASGVQFECSECQSTYKHKKSLNKHWKDKHPGLIRQIENTPPKSDLKTPNRSVMSDVQRHHPPASLKRLLNDLSDSESSPPGSLPSKRPHLSAFNRYDFNASLPLTPLRAPVSLPPVAHIIRPLPIPAATIPAVPLHQFESHIQPAIPVAMRPPFAQQHQPLHQQLALPPPLMTPASMMMFAPSQLPPEQGPPSILDLSVARTSDAPLDLSVARSKFGSEADRLTPNSLSSASSSQHNFASLADSDNAEALNLSTSFFRGSKSNLHHGHSARTTTGSRVDQTPPRTSSLTKCRQCQHCFTSSDALNEHFNECHKDVLTVESEKMNHWKTTFQLSAEELDNCRQTCGDASNPEVVYKCPLCDATARWPTEFQKHFQKHRRDRPCECCICGQSYKWCWDLVRHFNKQHASAVLNPYRKFQSQEKAGQAPATVDQSEASPPTELMLMCPRCQYRARWPSELRSHMVNHSGHRTYGCRFCNYRAKWKWDVAKHLKRCREAVGKVVLPAGNDYLVQFVNYIRPPPGDILLNYLDEEEEENHNKQEQLTKKAPEPRVAINSAADIKKASASSIQSEAGEEDELGNLVIDENTKDGMSVRSGSAPVLDPIPSFIEENKAGEHIKMDLVRKDAYDFDVEINDSKPPLLLPELPQIADVPVVESKVESSPKAADPPIKITIKRCPFCDFMSGNPKELQEHVQSHTFPAE